MSSAPSDPKQSPVLNVTSYDRVSASMIAIIMGLVFGVIWLAVIWATNRIPTVEGPVPVEMVELAGGDPDGAPDDSLKLESPEDVTDDPSLAEETAEDVEIQEMLENVVELADEATDQAQKQFATGIQNKGKPGSAAGTGRRALGMGPGEGGFPNEQRWFIRLSDRGTLSDYAKQLEFFGIELGALTNKGKLHILRNPTAAIPNIETKDDPGKYGKLLHMIWQGGTRKQGDIKLFKKANVDVTFSVMFHFYPAATERMLLDLEKKHKGQPIKKIRRTYFSVVRKGRGYAFVVTRQSYRS